MGNPRSHHALREALPTAEIIAHFGSAEPKEIAKEVSKLGQRDLQARFRVVYGTQTFSNNNTWLRRKLLEAAGLQAPKAAGRGRPTARTSKAASASHVHVQASDSLPLSRSSSLASQSTGNCTVAKADEVRRTKRARKPKLFDDMLVLGRHTVALSDDEDDKSSLDVMPVTSGRSSEGDTSRGSGRPHKHSPAAVDAPAAPGWVATSLLAAPAAESLVWARGAAQGFAAGHVLQAVSAATAWAPATPEPLPRWGVASAPELGAAARMAGCLLGDGPARCADLLLPDWARLPNSEPADSDCSAGTAADARGLGKRAYLQPGMGEPAGGSRNPSPPGTPPLCYLGAAAQIAPSSSGCYTEAALGLAPAPAPQDAAPMVLARSASACALDRLLEEMGSGDAAFCSGPAVGTDAATGEKLDAFWDSVDQATDALFEPRAF
ncbi:hypothetical protein WJX81_004707 [Elliptochloris bilobata]|uniref:Uncharacterized protein n=1 Tax=Elliptochloris bilobata TaxID=381761 RepID=A0AAW1RK46_9CHLO